MVLSNLNLIGIKGLSNDMEFSRSRNGRRFVIIVSHKRKKVVFKIVHDSKIVYEEEVSWRTAKKRLRDTLFAPIDSTLGRIKFAGRFHFIPLDIVERAYIMLTRKKGGVIFAR